MGAPRGNKFAEGHDGSGTGRPGSGIEFIRQQFTERFLDDLLNMELDPEKIVERIKGGKFFLGEYILYRAVVLGKDEILMVLMNKLFGDKRSFRPLINQPLSDEEKAELAEAMDRAFDEFPLVGYKPRMRQLTNGDANGNTVSPQRSRARKPRKKN